jgi:hypothetical protein
MNGILINLKRARYTISEIKSQFCIFRFRVIKFIYDILGRYSDTFKIIKIIKWPLPNNIAEARIFIKVTVYYKVFVKNFAVIAALIYSLIKKNLDLPGTRSNSLL